MCNSSDNRTDVARFSAGTVRFCIIGNDTKVVFVPDHDHSAKRNGKIYAVFFAEGNDDPPNCGRHRVRPLYPNNEGVLLDFFNPPNCPLSQAVLAAATTGSKVKIGVDTNYKITSITVPAQ